MKTLIDVLAALSDFVKIASEWAESASKAEVETFTQIYPQKEETQKSSAGTNNRRFLHRSSYELNAQPQGATQCAFFKKHFLILPKPANVCQGTQPFTLFAISHTSVVYLSLSPGSTIAKAVPLCISSTITTVFILNTAYAMLMRLPQLTSVNGRRTLTTYNDS